MASERDRWTDGRAPTAPFVNVLLRLTTGVCRHAGDRVALKRLLDFTPVFAELRLYERQTKRFVDVFFGGGGNDLAAAPQSIRPSAKPLRPASERRPQHAPPNRLREAA
jgi:hypothetical protein